MSLSKTPGRTRTEAALRQTDERRHNAWVLAVTLVVVGTLVFNLGLAFANTNLFAIRESYVVLSEMMLLGLALLLALRREASLYVILTLYLSYMALILALRPELDLKAIRDMLIPIIFYSIGTQFRQITEVDRLIWVSVVIVLGIGFFEFFFLGIYTSLVDIFQYYVARGTLEAGDNSFLGDSNLFVSSVRVGGRNFLGFLGELRASSVFLEPVTMGNFGAFLCMWALFRSGMRHRWLLFTTAFTAIILADARFGMMVCLAFFPVALVYRIVPKIVWWSIPFLFMFALALYGGWTLETKWDDNLTGRILHSAQIMMKLTPESLFGISNNVPFVADNGFAYTVTQIGLLGTMALLLLYMFAPVNDEKALQFKALVITYICLNLTISNSLYSIKLAALFWLAAGAADAMSRSNTQPVEVLAQRNPIRSHLRRTNRPDKVRHTGRL